MLASSNAPGSGDVYASGGTVAVQASTRAIMGGKYTQLAGRTPAINRGNGNGNGTWNDT
ncbi:MULTISPECIES: hypothetical protein [Burkholderiaceae]|uniref:Uncharacterized protein n=1 Tax=Caballeronia sordidicola TaxID=196367 RepID=A0A242MV11_CABSO|nr:MULTISPECIES: hypothetical protein [Burkholderiaceae]OTP74671.1 hypothetical protein PAMC26577_15340 [Caballeronia sordidicola]